MIPVEWTDAVRKWAQLNNDIEEVWLYGSRARGDATSESDLDLAVVPKGNANRKLCTYIGEAHKWREQIGAMLPVSVHLEFGDREQSNTIVGPALDREGIRLYPAE